MFTGIVEELGKVRAVEKNSSRAILVIEANKILEGSKIGDSVAVNGACLTLVGKDKNSFEAQVSAETLQKTDLGKLKPRDLVNLERALRATDRLGGHIVTGHVDGIGTVLDKREVGNQIVLAMESSPQVLPYLIPKGSVTVDGVSLTVVSVTGSKFTTVIIPHTATNTTLGRKKRGEKVNLEADIIGKYVKKYLEEKQKDSLTQLLGERVVRED